MDAGFSQEMYQVKVCQVAKTPTGQVATAWSITHNGSLFARIFSYEGHAFLCTFGNLNQSTLKA